MEHPQQNMAIVIRFTAVGKTGLTYVSHDSASAACRRLSTKVKHKHYAIAFGDKHRLSCLAAKLSFLPCCQDHDAWPLFLAALL